MKRIKIRKAIKVADEVLKDIYKPRFEKMELVKKLAYAPRYKKWEELKYYLVEQNQKYLML